MDTYMREALKEAQVAYKNGDVPVGCVIVKDGKIIARAHNTRYKENCAIGHAEINAIQEANKTLNNWVLEGCELYVTVEPCQMCSGAIIQSRIDKVIYGTKDIKAGCVDSLYNLLSDKRFNHQVEVESGVLADECASIIKKFFKQIRDEKNVRKIGE